MKRWTYGLLAVLAFNAAYCAAAADEGVTVDAQAKGSVAETKEQRDARMGWWREAKFGMFIHWGVYAVPAGSYGNNTGYGEWIMHNAKIPVAEYRNFAGQFNPVKYDPKAWVQVAKDAGMRYIVITSKHHDGFALFPSEASKWNVANATPYKKDLLAPLVEAAKAEGIKIGFYYSQAQDWNNPGGAKANYKEGEGWDEAHKGKFDEYLANVSVPQVREILTRYPIDILWWDTPSWMNAQRAKPFHEMLKLRPGIITNNRLGGGYSGDTHTPEQFVPVTGHPGDWETCMTLNGHWGYNAADRNWKSANDLIHKLADIAAKGGNFLLNVGPTAEGEFPPACVERLAEVGRWMKVNSESIYGTQRGPFPYLSWGCATRKGNRLYLHMFDRPANGELRVPLNNDVTGAYLLADPERSKLTVRREENRLVITLPQVPVTAPAPVSPDTVVVLDLTAEPTAMPMTTDGATATASATLKGNPPENAIDGTGEKRWRAPQDVKSATLEIRLAKPEAISAFGLDEPDVWPRMNQKYTLEVQQGEVWQKMSEGKTAGHGERRTVTPVTGQLFRLTISCDAGSPGVAELQLYRPE